MKPSDFRFLIVSTNPERSLRLLQNIECALPGSAITEAVSARHALDIISPHISSPGHVPDTHDWAKVSSSVIILDMHCDIDQIWLRTAIMRLYAGIKIIRVADLSDFKRNCISIKAACTQSRRVDARFKKVTASAA